MRQGAGAQSSLVTVNRLSPHRWRIATALTRFRLPRAFSTQLSQQRFHEVAVRQLVPHVASSQGRQRSQHTDHDA